MNSTALKNAGIGAVAVNNDAFVKMMRLAAVGIAQSKGKVTVCDIREHARSMGIAPTHCNAWGPVFRSPLFRRTGFARSRTVTAHSRVVAVWELAA